MLILAVIALLTRAGTAPFVFGQAAASPSLCFAFLRQGNVWIHCAAKTEPITTSGRIYDFAVSREGNYLAMYRSLGSAPPWQGAEQSQQIMLVALKNHFETSFSSLHLQIPRLRASCNTIVASERRVGIARSTYDVVTGKPVHDSSDGLTAKIIYIDFDCSSDMKEVLGIVNPRDTSFRSELAAGWSAEHYLSDQVASYNLSPSGGYFAYLNNLGLLCSSQIRGAVIDSRCLRISGEVGGRLSVSDAGDVLYDSESIRPSDCFYRDEQHFSPTRRPGYTSQDVCPAISVWGPDDQHGAIIENLARDPQWINEEQASLLKEMARHR
jgi:hypothetical protein